MSNTLTARGVSKVLELAAEQTNDPAGFMQNVADLLQDAMMSAEMDASEGTQHKYQKDHDRAVAFAADLFDELEDRVSKQQAQTLTATFVDDDGQWWRSLSHDKYQAWLDKQKGSIKAISVEWLPSDDYPGTYMLRATVQAIRIDLEAFLGAGLDAAIIK